MEEDEEEFSGEVEELLSTLTPSEAEALRKRFNVDIASGESPAKDLK